MQYSLHCCSGGGGGDGRGGGGGGRGRGSGGSMKHCAQPAQPPQVQSSSHLCVLPGQKAWHPGRHFKQPPQPPQLHSFSQPCDFVSHHVPHMAGGGGGDGSDIAGIGGVEHSLQARQTFQVQMVLHCCVCVLQYLSQPPCASRCAEGGGGFGGEDAALHEPMRAVLACFRALQSRVSLHQPVVDAGSCSLGGQ